MKTHICSFSALDDLKAKDRGNYIEVLKILEKAGRFSVFEATEHRKLATTLETLPKLGLVKYENDTYPWTKVKITKLGKAAIKNGVVCRKP